MHVHIVKGVDGARAATGTVVVIDVLRAFTTAAYAFAAGIDEIELVQSVEDALATPGFRMGEVGGRLIPGFDHNNSPSQLVDKQLAGRAVQRTGSGTRCVTEATRATEIWLGSLVVASATANALVDRHEVTLVASAPPGEGEEDLACARWLEARLLGRRPAAHDAIAAVLNSKAAVRHRADDSDLPLADLTCATTIDAFPFAMKVERHAGRLIARPFPHVHRE